MNGNAYNFSARYTLNLNCCYLSKDIITVKSIFITVIILLLIFILNDKLYDFEVYDVKIIFIHVYVYFYNHKSILEEKNIISTLISI